MAEEPARPGYKLILLALLVAAVALTLLYRHEPAPQQALRSSLLPPPDSAFPPRNFALSSDGTRLAFCALSSDGSSGLWLRTLSTSRAHRLDDTDGAAYPFWSPDGKHVGFFAENKLKTVDLASGAVAPLADTPIANGGTWGGDGVIVFSPGIGRPLYRISAEGGQSSPVTHIQPGRTAHTSSWPYFLPDGKHFLYSVQWTVPGESGTGLYASR
jgi:Tol biopolymer transport system component